eukprot:3142857-Amphidinium_carterae.1
MAKAACPGAEHGRSGLLMQRRRVSLLRRPQGGKPFNRWSLQHVPSGESVLLDAAGLRHEGITPLDI